MKVFFFLAALFALPTLLSSVAGAQENLVAKEQVKMSDQRVMGWRPSGKAGVNASLTSVSNVVGQTDGQSETYGLDLKSSYDFNDVGSEWRNSLAYQGASTKTSALQRYVKSTDDLKFESLYLYHLEALPKVGPYARVNASAPIFFGEDVRSAATTYNVQRRDGTVQTSTGTTLKLTDGFKPLTTKESAGGFWQAFNDGNVRIDARLGLGAQQDAAAGQLAVTGTDAAGVVTVSELKSVSVLGAEAALTAKGRIDERTGWEASVETLTPFVTNKDASDDRSALRLTNVEGLAKISSNLTAWAAVSYDYKLAIKPLLVDRTQQTHMLVLNMNYNLF